MHFALLPMLLLWVSLPGQAQTLVVTPTAESPASQDRAEPAQGEAVCDHVLSPLLLTGGGRRMAEQQRLNDPGVYEAFMSFRAKLRYTPTLRPREVTVTARWSRPNFEVVMPRWRTQEGPPPRVFYTVILVPREAMALGEGPRELVTDRAVRARVMPPEGEVLTDGRTRLSLAFDPPFGYSLQYWRLFVLPCVIPADARSAPTAMEFAEHDVLLTGRWFAAALGLGVVALIMFTLGQAAAAVNGWQMDPGKVGGGQRPIRNRFNPIFICQDAFGHASLARFQVLLFTVVLLGVYAYGFAASHAPPEVSGTVLTLLGITLAGSTLAAVANRPGLETVNRLWLSGTGVLRQSRRVPCWNDLITSDGEVDITRVQALGFSLFAACALVFLGAENLGSFEIPQQLNYLIGLSQAVYVAGRAIPVDTLRRLNEEMTLLRTSEVQAVGKAEGSAEWQEFMRVKTGSAVSLFDVFGGRMDRKRLLALRPGERLDET